jgi:hypothetical protein
MVLQRAFPSVEPSGLLPHLCISLFHYLSNFRFPMEVPAHIYEIANTPCLSGSHLGSPWLMDI